MWGVVAAEDLWRVLADAGFAAEKVIGSVGKRLFGLGVLVVDSHRLGDGATRLAIRRFVKGGGGLDTAGLGWGWWQLNPGRDLLRDHPGNLLLAEAGLVFADGALSDSAKNGFAAKGLPGAECHAVKALALLAGGAKLDREVARRAQAVLVRAVRYLPPDDEHLRPHLVRLLRARRNSDLPGPSSKLDHRHALARVLLAWELAEVSWNRPEKIEAHPASAAFPGEVVTATLSHAAASRGLGLRVGCHRDLLWGKESWSRAPEVTRSFPLERPRTKVATPFGGLIYVEVPKGGEGRVEVTVNLFSLYLCEKICGFEVGHGAMAPAKVRVRLAKYLASGARFADWKKDPFLALTMYHQLQREFGWEVFKTVFAQYRRLSPEERPKNDAEKRDQWLVRFPRVAGKNLGPFFDAWGVPVSEVAKRVVADLPEWMPEELSRGR